MFYTEKVASETTINLEDRRQCEDMMDRIYKEDPAKWPHGLNMSGFNGGCYMIRSASDGNPVGFTGWQEKRAADGKRVGYYSIGILPEYRRNGYAKAAVSQLLREKAANVHRVEAFVARGNIPSIALANKLGVDVVYNALTKRASKLTALSAILGGVGLTEAMDDNAGGGNGFFKDVGRAIIPGGETGNMTGNRIMRGVSNFVGGAAGGMGARNLLSRRGGRSLEEFEKLRRTGMMQAGMAPTMAIGTDLGLNAIGPLAKTGPALEKYIKEEPAQPGMSNKAKLLLGLAGVAGAGGLGWLMHKGNQATQDLANAAHAGTGGRVKLTLPTSDKNDVETKIDMPIEEIMLSRNIRQQLHRDTRRRLREEGNGRTTKRWKTKKLKSDEDDGKEDSDDKVVNMPKAAAHIRSMRNLKSLLK